MKIIDAHFHFRPEVEGFQETAKKSGHENTEKHLNTIWKENNIVYGIVMGNIGIELKDHSYPRNMSYCIGLDSNCFHNNSDLDYFLQMTEKHFQQPNCVGLKLYPGYCPYYVYDNMYFPFFKLAQNYHKPVAIHTGQTSRSDAFLKYSHPLTLDDIAAQFPEVQFIMCHFGNPWLADAAAVLSKNPNVCADLSGILEGNPNMETFFKENSAFVNYIKMWLSYVNDYKRILFGTDWPIINIPAYIKFISHIIPQQHYEAVFFENAQRIYNLKL